MPAEDLLIAVTQTAVAIAGFSGLIAAIRTAAPDGWHPRDIWSLAWMLGASIGALVLAFLPLWLMLLPWADDLAYRASSALAFLYIATFVVVMVATGRRLTRRGYPPRIPVFPAAVTLVLGVLALAVAVGAAGLLGPSIQLVYVGSLIALLVVSILALAIFLVLLARSTLHEP